MPVQTVELLAKRGRLSEAEALSAKIAEERAGTKKESRLRRYSQSSAERMHNALERAKDRAAYERREIQRLAAQHVSDTFHTPLMDTVIREIAGNASEGVKPYIRDEAKKAELIATVNEAIQDAVRNGGFDLHGGDAGSFSGGTDVRGLAETPDIDLIYTGLPKDRNFKDWTTIDINGDNTIPLIPGTNKRGVQKLEQVRKGVGEPHFPGDPLVADFIEQTMANMAQKGWEPQFNWLRSAKGTPIIAFNMTITHPVYGELPMDINIYHGDYAFGLEHRERFNGYIDSIAATQGKEAAGRVLRTVQELKRMFKEATEALPEQDRGTAKVAGFLVEGLVTHGATPLTVEEALNLIAREPGRQTRKEYMGEQIDQLVGTATGSKEEWISKIVESPALSDAAYHLMRIVAKRYITSQKAA